VSKYDVVVVGTVCCDIIFHGLPSFPALGEEIWTQGVELTAGGAMNSPVALSRLGLNVGLTTPIGNDLWGEIILSKIKEEGISTDLIQLIDEKFPQVSVALNYNGDRAFVSYGEKNNADRYQEHLRQVIQNHDTKLYHFYASSGEGHTAMISEAKKRGSKISLDTGWDPEWLKSCKIMDQIALADVFMPNLPEAQLITGKQDAYEALEELSKMTSTVVIKMGEKGAICSSQGKVYDCRPPISIKAVDATGAGDCFVAGFIYGLLKNMDMMQCLQIANYCGGASVATVGGYHGAPQEKEIIQCLENIQQSKTI
jgi:sugar/nucleoside kinase (ribokinase family)